MLKRKNIFSYFFPVSHLKDNMLKHPFLKLNIYVGNFSISVLASSFFFYTYVIFLVCSVSEDIYLDCFFSLLVEANLFPKRPFFNSHDFHSPSVDPPP